MLKILYVIDVTKLILVRILKFNEFQYSDLRSVGMLHDGNATRSEMLDRQYYISPYTVVYEKFFHSN